MIFNKKRMFLALIIFSVFFMNFISSTSVINITSNSTSPEHVYGSTDWLINLTVTNNNYSTFMSHVQFYLNDVATGDIQSLNTTNNTNTLVATFIAGNFSSYDNLTAEYWIEDDETNTTKINLTDTVEDTAPVTTILAPPNESIIRGDKYYTPAAESTPELIANILRHYKLEGTTGVVIDSTDTLNSTLEGSISRGVDGQVGYGFGYPGETDTSFTTGVPGASATTVSMWVKNNDTSSSQLLFEKGFGSGSYLQARVLAGGVLQMTMFNGFTFTTDTYMQQDTWTHVAFSWGGNEGVKIYMNGVLNYTHSHTGYGTTSTAIVIGGTTFWSSLNGSIDEVAIYDDYLSNESILALYENGLDEIAYPYPIPYYEYDNYINWTTTDYDNDTFITNITLENGTSTVLASNIIQSTSSYLWDSTGFALGNYTLNVTSCENNTLDLLCSSDTLFITILDTVAPTISIDSPTNVSYYNNLTVPLNIITDGTESIAWYSLNGGANTTFIINSTVTGVNGLNNITVWVNDSYGNENSSFTNFSIDAIIPSVTIGNPLNDAQITSEITLPISIIATDNIQLVKCYYNLTSSLYNVYNIEIIDCSSTSRFLDKDGVYTLSVWVTDLAENIGYDTVGFEIQKESGTGGGGGGGYYSVIIDTILPFIINDTILPSILNDTEYIDSIITGDVIAKDKIDISFKKVLIIIGFILSIIFIYTIITYSRIKRFGNKK